MWYYVFSEHGAPGVRRIIVDSDVQVVLSDIRCVTVCNLWICVI